MAKEIQFSRGATLKRNSGIEGLKVGAILLIIVSHVIQTLSSETDLLSYSDYVIDLSMATRNVQWILLAISSFAGKFGNYIFFVCSAWFLLESKRCNKKKWFFMLLNIWTISVIILAITFVVGGGGEGRMDWKIFVKSFLPTTFSNNWYMTCYLLFYPIHPFLNDMISKLDQKTLFRACFSLLILYAGFNFIHKPLFYETPLMLWITLYFTIAYIRLYGNNYMSNTKVNVVTALLGLAGHVSMYLMTNFLGLRISFFSDKFLFWGGGNNPFLILTSISLLNLALKCKKKNYFINRLAGMSMLIYIIHENIILRTYYRPFVINYIYEKYGYRYICLWVVLIASVIFCLSASISFLYERSIERIVKAVSDNVYMYLRNAYLKFEQRMLSDSCENMRCIDVHEDKY